MPSANIDQVIANARALIQSSQPDKALELLTPLKSENESSVPFLQIFGEVLLETSDLENAYQVLTSACTLDSEAELGTEKFFYLGQIIGGIDGIKYVDVGLTKLADQLNLIQEDQGERDFLLVQLAKLYPTKELLISYLIKKLNQGIFAKIEIWMTDLCMEPEAEQQCDDLINHSLLLDPENPEALSLLASIRISQQRPEEAKESLLKSWTLFQAKKSALEESANKLQENNEDAFDVGMEYVELIQPLLTLARFAIELESYDLAISITSNTQDVNEDILDAYYYEALANILNAKKLYHQLSNVSEDYRDIELDILKSTTDENIQNSLKEAKSALVIGYKIINSDAGSEAEQELVEQVNDLLNQLGGASMADLLPKRDDGDDEGWEDEIESDNE